MSSDKNRRLQELGGSDFKIAEGQPEIKGWDVKDENGRKLGEVDELIFDTHARKVRYIVLDLDGNDFDLDTREVLVPIGIAQLHEDDDDVILPGVTAAHLQSLPDYDEDQLDTGIETRTRDAFVGIGGAGIGGAMATGSNTSSNYVSDSSGTGSDDDFYRHEHFNDEKFYGSRYKGTDDDYRDTDEQKTIPVIKEDIEIGKKEVETGGIRLNQRIVENEVEENITLREENVNVERNSVDRPASSDDIREQEIEMSATQEVPVVNKTSRVVEEVSLNKEVNEREETIRDTVRNTEVDVDKIDKDEDRDRNI